MCYALLTNVVLMAPILGFLYVGLGALTTYLAADIKYKVAVITSPVWLAWWNATAVCFGITIILTVILVVGNFC